MLTISPTATAAVATPSRVEDRILDAAATVERTTFASAPGGPDHGGGADDV